MSSYDVPPARRRSISPAIQRPSSRSSARQVHAYLLAVVRAGEQLLLLAVLVVRDDGVGRGQHVAHAAVVLFQLHRVRVRVVLLELQDVADVGATPAVDGLVVVAHHHDVLVLRGQKPRDGVLGVVRVLVFVHHEVAEAVLIGVQHVGVVLQQQVRVEQADRRSRRRSRPSGAPAAARTRARPPSPPGPMACFSQVARHRPARFSRRICGS